MGSAEVRLPRSIAVLGVLAALTSPAAPAAGQDVPVPVRAPDPLLSEQLDAALALAPPDTCLRVVVDGVAVHDHRGSDLQSPASTQKVFTAATVLGVLGADRTLRTELVAAAAPVGGVIAGDVTLVGGGDPVLTTSTYRDHRRLPADRPITLLDAFVDQLQGAGVTEIRGRIRVDDGRYDAQRRVPFWPERITADDPAPLGALVVDDGFLLRPTPEGGVEEGRPDDPAVAAGDALAWLLASRGIRVTVPGTVRAAPPPGGAVVAAVDSPPMAALVADLLRRSDNHIADQLLKELGVAAEGRGETAAGARAVAAWAQANGAAADGARVVDGSGLDPTNATSCQALVAALDAVGPDGIVAGGLPVAGRSGTLAGRFGDTAAAGRMRAKTGSLDDVTALAGFVDLAEGGTATFALVANGEIGEQALTAERLVAELLATWEPPCPSRPAAPLAAPLVAPTLALAAAPGGALASMAPGLVLTAAALEDPATAPIDRCAREDGTVVEVGIG